MSVFRGFRRLIDAIQSLALALEGLAQIQRELGPAVDRLEVLERSRNQFEAECEGMLLKADGKLKAASSSEQRERQIKKANERFTDPLSDESTAATEGYDPADVAVAPNAGAGPPEGVPPMRLVLAANNKAHAVRTKWGLA